MRGGGADRNHRGLPRITAEMMIPWSALGNAAPAPGSQLRAEIAITSWDRERWMSLSGSSPDAAMNHPEAWRAMRLGNASQMIESLPLLPVAAPG
jgi:hypothetical protein